MGRVKSDIEYVRRRRELINFANSARRILGNRDRETPVKDADEVLFQQFLKLANLPDIKLHRFYPSRPLGGALGMLDFRRETLIKLIELGFQDCVEHDCGKSHCVQ